MKIVVLLIFIFSFQFAHANKTFSKGVGFDVSLGKGGANIENPDDTKANYDIFAINARGLIPLYDGDDVTFSLVGGGRFLDLENTANSAAQSEVGSLIGPGAGLQLRMYKLFVGYEMHYLIGRHYAVGAISHSTKYEMLTSNLYGGIIVPFKQLSVSLSYSQASGSVPSSSTHLSGDAPYADQIYWIQLTYSTGASFSEFLRFLF